MEFAMDAPPRSYGVFQEDVPVSLVQFLYCSFCQSNYNSLHSSVSSSVQFGKFLCFQEKACLFFFQWHLQTVHSFSA